MLSAVDRQGNKLELNIPYILHNIHRAKVTNAELQPIALTRPEDSPVRTPPTPEQVSLYERYLKRVRAFILKVKDHYDSEAIAEWYNTQRELLVALEKTLQDVENKIHQKYLLEQLLAPYNFNPHAIDWWQALVAKTNGDLTIAINRYNVDARPFISSGQPWMIDVNGDGVLDEEDLELLLDNNHDGIIDSADYSAVLLSTATWRDSPQAYFTAQALGITDLNQDGRVDSQDSAIFFSDSNWANNAALQNTMDVIRDSLRDVVAERGRLDDAQRQLAHAQNGLDIALAGQEIYQQALAITTSGEDFLTQLEGLRQLYQQDLALGTQFFGSEFDFAQRNFDFYEWLNNGVSRYDDSEWWEQREAGELSEAEIEDVETAMDVYAAMGYNSPTKDFSHDYAEAEAYLEKLSQENAAAENYAQWRPTSMNHAFDTLYQNLSAREELSAKAGDLLSIGIGLEQAWHRLLAEKNELLVMAAQIRETLPPAYVFGEEDLEELINHQRKPSGNLGSFIYDQMMGNSAIARDVVMLGALGVDLVKGAMQLGPGGAMVEVVGIRLRYPFELGDWSGTLYGGLNYTERLGYQEVPDENGRLTYQEWRQERYALFVNPTVTNGRFSFGYLGYTDLLQVKDGKTMFHQVHFQDDYSRRFLWVLKAGYVDTALERDATVRVTDLDGQPVDLPVNLFAQETYTFGSLGWGVKLGEDGNRGHVIFFLRGEQDTTEFQMAEGTLVLPGVNVKWTPIDNIETELTAMTGDITRLDGKVNFILPKRFSLTLLGGYNSKFEQSNYGLYLGLPLASDRNLLICWDRLNTRGGRLDRYGLKVKVFDIAKKARELPRDAEGDLLGLEFKGEELHNLSQGTTLLKMFDYLQPPIRAPCAVNGEFQQPEEGNLVYFEHNGAREEFLVLYGNLAQEISRQGLRNFGVIDDPLRGGQVATEEPQRRFRLYSMSLAQLDAAGIKVAEGASFYFLPDNGAGIPEEVKDLTRLTPEQKSRTYATIPLYSVERAGKKLLLPFVELGESEIETARPTGNMPLFYFEYQNRRIPLNYYEDKETRPVVNFGQEHSLIMPRANDLPLGYWMSGQKAFRANAARDSGMGWLYSDELGVVNIEPASFTPEVLDSLLSPGSDKLYAFPAYRVYLAGSQVKVEPVIDAHRNEHSLRFELRDFVLGNQTARRAIYEPGREAKALLDSYAEIMVVFRDVQTGKVFYRTVKELYDEKKEFRPEFSQCGLEWSTKAVKNYIVYILSVKATEATPQAFKAGFVTEPEYRLGANLPAYLGRIMAAHHRDNAFATDTECFWRENDLIFRLSWQPRQDGRELPKVERVDQMPESAKKIRCWLITPDLTRGLFKLPQTTFDPSEVIPLPVRGSWWWFDDANNNGY
jgi:hypothetical protein